jgi:hypothetical protein
MPAPRITTGALTRHLVDEPPATRRLVRALRRSVLSAAPGAAEAFRFHALCYFHPRAFFGAIGGHICFIELRGGRVLLSFIHGAALPDPKRLLFGRGKSKRFVHIPDEATASSAAVRSLVRAAAALHPWD